MVSITSTKTSGKGEARSVLTAAHEDLVCAVLIAQLRSVALARLEFDGDLLLVEQVGALEDDAEAALANLLADAVVHADDVGARAAARHGVDGVRITEGREKGGGREWQRVRGLVVVTAARQGRSRRPGTRLCNRRTRLGVAETAGRGRGGSDLWCCNEQRARGRGGQRKARRTGTYSEERATDSRRGKDVEKGKERLGMGRALATYQPTLR